jgi:hypothetical protein
VAARSTLGDEHESSLVVVFGEAEIRRLSGLGRRALTRKRLVTRLREHLAPEVILASSVAVELALAGLLEEIAKTTPWLLRIVERGGRARADLVLEVRKALAEARRMLWFEPLATWREGGSSSDARALVLAGTARELDRILARAGLVDPSAEAEFVARTLVTSPVEAVVEVVGGRSLIAAGIFSWLPQDLIFWRALDAKLSLAGGGATIELVAFERQLDAVREPDPLERLIDAVAEGLDAAPRTRLLEPVLGDFRFVEPLPETTRARVAVRRCDSVRGQASAIAEAVYSVLETGASAEDVAIVVPDGVSLASLRSGEHDDESREVRAAIRRALEEAGIAVHATVPDAPAAGGLLAFALETLALADAGLPRLAFASWLGSSYLDPSRITGMTDERAAVDALHLLARILRSTPTAAGEDPTAVLAATVLAHGSARWADRTSLAALARRIGGVVARARSGGTRAEHAANAERLFEDLGIAARPGPGARAHFAADAPARSIVRAEVLAYARDTQDHANLRSELAHYGRTADRLGMAEGPSTFESFRLELEHALGREEATTEGRAAGAVRVCTWQDLPARSLALLAVADAHEGAFGAQLDEAPLLDGALRVRLTEALEPALRASVFVAHASGLALLASAVHSAARVVFASRTRDEHGGSIAAHPLVAWLEREGIEVEAWRDKVTTKRPVSKREFDLAVLARSPGEALTRAPWAARRAEIEARREEAAGVASPAVVKDASGGSMTEAFCRILTEETGGQDRAMSVTSLDRFGACRFQGFAAGVLGAKPPLEQLDMVDAREEGILLHGALAAAFRATHDLWTARPRDAETIREGVARAADAFLARSRAASSLRRAVLDAVKGDVSRVVEWSLADEEWDFACAEATFGRAEEDGRVGVLHDGRTTLRLRGSIDRVDVAHGRARLRVIDYKRSQDSARRFTDVLGETGFQIAVYGRAASEALGLAVEDGLYLPTLRLPSVYRPKGPVASWATAHEELEGIPRFERRALDIVARVRGGDVEPRPPDPEVCERCDFDGACRKPRFVIAALSVDELDESNRESPLRDRG